MDSQTKQDQTSQIFGITGFVIAILSFVFSMIPCIGFYAFIPALLATAFSFIAYRKQKMAEQASSLSLAGTIIGVVAITVASYQYYTFSQVFKDVKKIDKEMNQLIINTIEDSIQKHMEIDSIQREHKDSAK